MPDKTIIGVLGSHDDPDVNKSLVAVLNALYREPEWRSLLEQFQFLVTGGMHDRVITGEKPINEMDPTTTGQGVDRKVKEFLGDKCGVTRLPETRDGGVTLLSYFVVNGQCSVVWAFLSPSTAHWILPENLALIRLCDYYRVKRLMNQGSVIEWIQREAVRDAETKKQPRPPTLKLRPYADPPRFLRRAEWEEKIRANREAKPEKADWTLNGATIAVIAHDQMKERMLEFVTDYEQDLGQVNRILATGTTGRHIQDAAPSLEKKVYRYRSGPKGGDIQIATEILMGACDVVFFSVDPLHPHAHIDDIRVVFGACMARKNVRIFTSEVHAREWMDRLLS